MKKKIWVLVGIAAVLFVSSPQAATKGDGPPLPIPAGFPPLDAEISPEGKIEGKNLVVWASRKLSAKEFVGCFCSLTPDGTRTEYLGDIGRRPGGMPIPTEGIIFVYNNDTGKTIKLIGRSSPNEFLATFPQMVYDRKTGTWTVSGSSIRKPVSLKGDSSKEMTIPRFAFPTGFPPFYAGLPIEEKTEGKSLAVYAVRELSANVFEGGYWKLIPDGKKIIFSGDIVPQSQYDRMRIPKDGYIFVYNVETEKITRLAGKVSMVHNRKTKTWTVSGSIVPK
jgi:hypothetical protein